MSYKIAICDDEEIDRKYIASLITKWSEKNNYSIHISLFSSSENFLFHYDNKNNYDILLLDIEMGAMDGVSLAKLIRQNNDTLQIIFITGFSDYIQEGYEVSALHYLMKPVKEEKLFNSLDRAIINLAKKEKVLNIEINNELVLIPVYQIMFAEVFGNYVTIHSQDEYKVKMTLGELEKLLDDQFYRVGRSVIVNLTKISRVTKKEIKLTDGSLIPLPRGAYEGVNRAIINMG